MVKGGGDSSADLSGKVAIVTGAGGGVGRAYAHALAQAGASVVVNDLGGSTAGHGASLSMAQGVADEILQAGGKATANGEDVASFAGAARIVECAVDTYGKIDILVANAGNQRPSYLHEMSEEDWTSVMAVHANGTFNCYRHAVPHMIRQNSGTVITTGAAMVQGYFPGLAAYRAAKAAILVLTFSGARELAGYRINVNSVMPGATRTRMHKKFIDSMRGEDAEIGKGFRPPAEPETVPPLGLYLCSEAGRKISGYSFHVYARQIAAVRSLGELGHLEADGETWALGELSQKVPGWLDQIGAVTG